VAFSAKIYCKFTAECACRRILKSFNIWLSYSGASVGGDAIQISPRSLASQN